VAIYFYDDCTNGKVAELRKRLEAGCPPESRAQIFRGALKIVNSEANSRWFDKYCSIVADISSHEPGQREPLFYYLGRIVSTPDFFELHHLDYIERMLSSIGRAHSYYGLFLVHMFISCRRQNLESFPKGAWPALPEAGGITLADVSAMCLLVNLMASKCNGSLEESMSMLAGFFSKKSFRFNLLPSIDDAISVLDGHEIPPYLEKLNSTFS
jgi:hypothetical protein